MGIFSVAFGNHSGGYELRNPYFKGAVWEVRI